jgi:PEP-CTERM motif-containing protein
MRVTSRLKLAGAILAAALSASAQAAVTMPGGDALGKTGDFININYGAGGLGNVFQLNALLYVDEVKSTDQIVNQLTTFTKLAVDRNGFGPTGLGTGIAEFDYRVTNVGTTVQSDLRFMSVIGVDGNPTTLNESVAETWGGKQAFDPDRRQTSIDPTLGLNSIWIASNGAAGPQGSGVPAACASPSVCDAFVGLQWDIPSLNPGQSFLVRVGLSDDGQHLSSRYFTITGDPTGGISNALTFSGTAQVVSVPEPSSYAMLLGGLALIALAWRRRSSQQI